MFRIRITAKGRRLIRKATLALLAFNLFGLLYAASAHRWLGLACFAIALPFNCRLVWRAMVPRRTVVRMPRHPGGRPRRRETW